MSVNEKMTAIADELRALLEVEYDPNDPMTMLGLDDMAEFMSIIRGLIESAYAAAISKGGTEVFPTLPMIVNLQGVIESIPQEGSAQPVLQSKSATPSETAQTIRPDSGYQGLSSVSVGAISSTYVGSGVTRKAAQTYNPGTSDQTIASGQYLSGTQTIKGDANLKAANIKSGVSIFGVAGTASAGVTVQRKAGTLTTNSDGQASVNVGFKPDIVLFTGFIISSEGLENQAAAVFPEITNYPITLYATSGSFPNGVFLTPTQTNNGFDVLVLTVTSGGTSLVGNRQFPYVAIKYT